MRPKVKFKRRFVYMKTLGHLQENPDLFNLTLQRPRFIGAGWDITPPIISQGFFFFSFCIHTSSCNLCVTSNVPIKHNANFLLSHVFVSLVFRAYYDWNRVHSILRVSRSFNMPVSVRVFLNLFCDCFISTIKLRLSDIRDRNFVSFCGWAIGVINGMLFLLLTKVLISRVL